MKSKGTLLDGLSAQLNKFSCAGDLQGCYLFFKFLDIHFIFIFHIQAFHCQSLVFVNNNGIYGKKIDVGIIRYKFIFKNDRKRNMV